MDHREVTHEMLLNPVQLVTNNDLDFKAAKTLADTKAGDIFQDPMLLAWYDRKGECHSPTMICGCGEKPSWLAYAQERGGSLSIVINEGEFLFIYRDNSVD